MSKRVSRKKKTHKKWDRMYEEETSSLEDENYRLRRNYTVDHIINSFDKSVQICDLGCGAGPVTYEMLKRGYNIVGLDYLHRHAAKRQTTVDCSGYCRKATDQ